MTLRRVWILCLTLAAAWGWLMGYAFRSLTP